MIRNCLLIAILALIGAGVTSAQVIQTLCQGQDAYLYASPPSSSDVQWQNSVNGTVFTDIPNATYDTLALLNIQVGAFYRAIITGPLCNPYATEVKHIIVSIPPTIANAGVDTVALSTTIQLYGNTPVNGQGSWSIISGTGGTLGNPGNPQSSFTGISDSIYLLTWTISNPPCTPSVDTVMITMPSGTTLPSVQCNGATLYIHPTDNGNSVWGCAGFASGATDQDDGAYNTAIISQSCTQPSAAIYCDDLVAFGYSDWYLPAYNELQCLRANAATIGGFQNTTYWSSTEGAGILYLNAYYRTFPSGTSGAGSKSSSRLFRCVRK